MPTDAFVDADLGDRLNYSATLADGTNLPAWLQLDAATGTFSGTPGNDNVGAVDVQVTASFGVASFPGDGRSRKELLRMADEAMYLVKKNERNSIAVAGQGMLI